LIRKKTTFICQRRKTLSPVYKYS